MSAKVVLKSKQFDENDVEIGAIIWFVNKELEEPTEYSHPHIIVAVEDNYVHVVCGTSQQETVERIIKNFSSPWCNHSCFPAFSSTDITKLSKTTFFNCTTCYDVHMYDLRDRYENGEDIFIEGKINYGQYDQIRTALKKSPTIDICDLLIHPEDEN